MMMAKLGEVCTVVSGTTPNSGQPEYWNGNLNWITPAELTDEIDVIYETQRKITEQAVIDRKLKSFPAGTVLLSSRAPIGKVAIAGIEMYCNQGFKNLICSGRIYNRYLYYFLKDKTDYLNSLGRGATFKEISKSIVENIEIPLPTLDEQHKIAAVLDKVSDLIAKRRQQLDKLDEMVKARFVEMFGDPDENSKHWQEDKLSHHLKVIGGFAFKSDGFTDKGIPVLRIGNINSGHFRAVNMVYWPDDLALERYKVFPGDLVMSLTGTVGKDDYGNVCILGTDYDEYYLNQRNAKLSIKDSLNKFYFSELLKFSGIKKRLTGINRGIRQANISNKDILALRVPIPPIELQEQFAAFVEQIEKAKANINHSLEKLEILKKALMQEYFE